MKNVVKMTETSELEMGREAIRVIRQHMPAFKEEDPQERLILEVDASVSLQRFLIKHFRDEMLS